MESARYLRNPQGLAGLLALALVAGTAVAGTAAGSLRIGIRITASCQVDSAPVVQASAADAIRAPRIDCPRATPGAVSVSREPAGPAGSGAGGAAGADEALVVTLTF